VTDPADLALSLYHLQIVASVGPSEVTDIHSQDIIVRYLNTPYISSLKD